MEKSEGLRARVGWMAKWIVAVSIFFAQCASADPIVYSRKILRYAGMIPVYRELNSQNIARLIKSLYDQNLNGLGYSKIELYFIVNNTEDVAPEIFEENIKTVQFLKALGKGEHPQVPPGKTILGEVAELPIASKLDIHVIDKTSPGFPERNIGVVRDTVLQKFLSTVTESEMDTTLIAQMDADCVYAPNYMRIMTRAFEIQPLFWAVGTYGYSDEAGFEPKVYQRKIVSDYGNNAFNLGIQLDGDTPYAPTPITVATAQAMKKIGGIPHLKVAEDVQLGHNLKADFGLRYGRFLPAEVSANYRARADSYDGALYLENLDKPVEFSEKSLWFASKLEDTLIKINKDPLLKAFYEESLEQILAKYASSVDRLKTSLKKLVDKRQASVSLNVPDDSLPALLNNTWVESKIDEVIKTHTGLAGSIGDAVLAEFEKLFPYYFSSAPDGRLLESFQMEAASRTLQIKPYVESQGWLNEFFNEFRSSMPKFIEAFDLAMLKRLKARISNNSIPRLKWSEKFDLIGELRGLYGAKAQSYFNDDFSENLKKANGIYLNTIIDPSELMAVADLAREIDFKPCETNWQIQL